jgi:hypothetical protein
MKTSLSTIAFTLSIFLTTSQSFALSPEQMVDLYLLEAQAAYKNGNYSSAAESFSKIEELNVDIDDDFYFFYAKSLSEGGNDHKAWIEINTYLENTGRAGKHYTDALSLYGVLETKISKDIKSDLSKLYSIQQKWLTLAQKYKINSDIESWLNTQVSRTEYLIDGHQYELAKTNIEQSIKNCNSYINNANRLANNLQNYQNNIAPLSSAVKNKQIDKDIINYHYEIISRLNNHLTKMETNDFLSTYVTAKKKLDADIRETERVIEAIKDKKEQETKQKAAQHEQDILDNSYNLAKFILNSSMCKQYSSCNATYDKGYVKIVAKNGNTTKTAIIDFTTNSNITVSHSSEQNPGFITYSIEISGKVIQFLDENNRPTDEGLVFKTKDHLYGAKWIMPEPGSNNLPMSEPVELTLEEGEEQQAFYVMEKNIKFLNECYSKSY